MLFRYSVLFSSRVYGSDKTYLQRTGTRYSDTSDRSDIVLHIVKKSHWDSGFLFKTIKGPLLWLFNVFKAMLFGKL